MPNFTSEQNYVQIMPIFFTLLSTSYASKFNVNLLAQKRMMKKLTPGVDFTNMFTQRFYMRRV